MTRSRWHSYDRPRTVARFSNEPETYKGADSMNRSSRRGSVQRMGQIYRFSIVGTEYAAFIWQFGKQYRGRIEGNPLVPECTARTALAVRDALQLWLTAHDTPVSHHNT